jgi:hypothetical protein
MDLRSEKSPLCCISARQKLGGFGSGRSVKDCLCPSRETTESMEMVTIPHPRPPPNSRRPSRTAVYPWSNPCLLCLCPVGYGTGRRDATECLTVPLGRAWVRLLRDKHPEGGSPDRSPQWVPNHSKSTGCNDAGQGNSETSFRNSASDHARTVLVDTLPIAPTASTYLATLSPFGAFTMVTISVSPLVKKTCSISTPIFLASSRAPWTRFAVSLILRLPWSVRVNDTMKCMTSSLKIVFFRSNHAPTLWCLQVSSPSSDFDPIPRAVLEKRLFRQRGPLLASHLAEIEGGIRTEHGISGNARHAG